MQLRRVLVARRIAQRWLSTEARANKNTSGNNAGEPTTVRSVTPGTLRIRRGRGADAKEVEMDSTIARIIGSDWGDRRNQAVSLPMRLYWGIFIIVLANGLYTYFSGNDESYLVDKLQKKVDAKLGKVETNEYVVMAANGQENQEAVANNGSKASGQTRDAPQENAATASTKSPAPSVAPKSPPSSVLKSSAVPTMMPFFSQASAAPTQPRSKADLEAQLHQLRLHQQQLQEKLKSGDNMRDLEDVEHEIRMIDEKKAQVKRMIKRL